MASAMDRDVAKYVGVACRIHRAADSNVLTSILAPLQTRPDLAGTDLRPGLASATIAKG